MHLCLASTTPVGRWRKSNHRPTVAAQAALQDFTVSESKSAASVAKRGEQTSVVTEPHYDLQPGMSTRKRKRLILRTMSLG